MREMQANRAWRLREPGYYVVNPRTLLAVAGPFPHEAGASAEALRRNSAPPTALDLLEVCMVQLPPVACHATEQRYLCETCGRLGPMSTFQEECQPGWTHGQLIKVNEAAPDGLSEPGYFFKFPCLYPLPDGQRCCECEACQGMGSYASRRDLDAKGEVKARRAT